MTYSDSNLEYLTDADIEGLLLIIAETWPEHFIQVRDAGLLDSAIHRPRNAPPELDILELSFMYFESFEGNQSLVDGNKRLAIYSVGVFLDKNGYEYEWDDDEAYDFVIDLVQDRPISKERFKNWLFKHITKFSSNTPLIIPGQI